MTKTKICLFFAVLTLTIACKKQPDTVTPPIDKTYTLVEPPTGWTKSIGLSTGFPTTAAIFETTTPFRAWACVVDLNDTTLSLRTALNTARQTPSNWLSSISSTGKRVLMLANAGYFDLTNGASYSLVVDGDKVQSLNVKALSRTFNGAATSYFPTRGAFGIVNGQPAVGWVYNTSGSDNHIYPNPSPNALNSAPQPVPTATFPANGSLWKPSVAIGGSPVLVYKNAIKITDAEELIDINNTTGRSRTAIGFTADKRVVIMVIERNSTGTTSGASLAQTAQLMRDWKCTDALNLDGGGSSCMLTWGNQSTNAPEAGSQRAVTSVIYIEKR
jgi:Phosphodiester glycosidase